MLINYGKYFAYRCAFSMGTQTSERQPKADADLSRMKNMLWKVLTLIIVNSEYSISWQPLFFVILETAIRTHENTIA